MGIGQRRRRPGIKKFRLRRKTRGRAVSNPYQNNGFTLKNAKKIRLRRTTKGRAVAILTEIRVLHWETPIFFTCGAKQGELVILTGIKKQYVITLVFSLQA